MVDEVENNLKAVHKEYPGCQAIIVAKTGFSRQAKEYAEGLDIITKTYDELLRGIINFDSADIPIISIPRPFPRTAPPWSVPVMITV